MRYFSFLVAALLLGTLCGEASAQTARHHRSRQQGLFTQTNIEKAVKTASISQKPLLVMFTSNHCKFCEKMLSETYGHPGVQQMLAGHTETVLAHADDYRDLTKKLGIRGYPTSLLISPQGKILDLVEGYVAPKEFAKRVGPILASHNTKKLASTSRQTAER